LALILSVSSKGSCRLAPKVLCLSRRRYFFAQVEVNTLGGSVFWPTGADLAPEFLYYGRDTPYGRVEFESPVRVAAGAEKTN
jgi:hypothetical protein